VGRRVAIVNWYQDWGVDRSHFTYNVTKARRGIAASGRQAMLTWEPYNGGHWNNWTNRQITHGRYDRYIKTVARRIRGVHQPLYLRFAHEMNGNWYPWGVMTNHNSARSYKRMWIHVHKVFDSVGATNVRWVWSPLTEDSPHVPSNKFEKYYPGRRWVDVLGMSGFNWGASVPQFGGWRSFNQVFHRGYQRISRLGPQPVWITEIGSASDGGDKAQWVRDMWATASQWPRLQAIVWYNQDKEKDWSTTSVASSFAG
jgi:beta-mannanase